MRICPGDLLVAHQVITDDAMVASIASRWDGAVAGGRVLVEVQSPWVPEPRFSECASARGLDLERAAYAPGPRIRRSPMSVIVAWAGRRKRSGLSLIDSRVAPYFLIFAHPSKISGCSDAAM